MTEAETEHIKRLLSDLRERPDDQEIQTSLFQENAGLIRWAVLHYRHLLTGRCDLDADDLQQCAALGVLEAARRFDPERGSWGAFCLLYVRNYIFRALGITAHTDSGTGMTVWTRPVLPTSLDDPIPGTEDGLTLMDTIEDENTPDPDEGIAYEAMRREIISLMQASPYQHMGLLRLNLFEGWTPAALAEKTGTPIERVYGQLSTAKLRLRRDIRRRWALWDLIGPGYYRHKGVSAFHTSGSSAVEDIVIERERLRMS